MCGANTCCFPPKMLLRLIPLLVLLAFGEVYSLWLVRLKPVEAQQLTQSSIFVNSHEDTPFSRNRRPFFPQRWGRRGAGGSGVFRGFDLDHLINLPWPKHGYEELTEYELSKEGDQSKVRRTPLNFYPQRFGK
ncbi:unnamed protein product [Calicophoron daubneyi]|uniref:Uncharacterized protein n=1 Tax=Calicophoron daubneyi TaxID=300641 RepID=A0AAV2SY82_CALDB